MVDRGETLWGGRILYKESTTSTMDDAQTLEDEGLAEGSLAWAGFQTAGRGRYPGRVWRSDAAASLTFTVFWSPRRFAVPGFAPSLTVGLGLCLWLESLGLDAKVALKWPNDVYLGEGKLAGILVRSRWGGAGPRSIHAGIGINLVTPRPENGELFRVRPSSLADAGKFLDPQTALEDLLPFLDRALVHPDPQGECQSRLWRRHQPFELSLPGGDGVPLQGIARGLDASGCLVWEGPEGTRILSSGE